MKNAKIIALSAVTTAFAVIFLVVGSYFPTLSLSGAFMASLTMMIPLSKKSYKGALLCFLATSILSMLVSGFRWDAVFPFMAFTGLHPIANYFIKERNLNRILFTVLKDIWFVGAVVLTQLITKLYVGENEFLNKYIYPVLIIGGAIVFPLYDFLMMGFQRSIVAIINRLKL